MTIQELRKRRGLTQGQLAEALGTTRVTIARYETGERTPRLQTIEKLAAILQVTPGEVAASLLQRNEQPKASRQAGRSYSDRRGDRDGKTGV